MVYISDTAKEKIIELMNNEGLSPKKSFLRIGVKSGGCSGLSYDLSFDNTQEMNDNIFEYDNVKILINKDDLLYLDGIQLEYSGGLNGKGFYFNNPNAIKTCGCGESFSS